MIVTSPAEFLSALAALPPPDPNRRATANAAFLVAPAGDRLACESAADNRYMRLDAAYDPARALAEHAALAQALRADVPVITFPGDPEAPDGMFPNNAFASVPGRFVIGRMRHAVRRREAARADIRAFFRDALGCTETDLSGRDDLVAELTGSLVIDHARGIGYCGLGERCDLAGARAMDAAFGLGLTYCFELAAGEYHANVVMACLAGRALVIAADGFRDPAAAVAIEGAYADSVLRLSPEQKRAYAGNAITLAPDRVWLSQRAAASLSRSQLDSLAAWGFDLGTVPLDEIEKAGGSLRCCVAEIFTAAPSVVPRSG